MALPAWLRPWRVASIPSTEVTVSPILQFLSSDMMGKSPEELWRTQPHLRTVVDFLSRNVAQLGLQAFQRQPDGGRERVRDGRVARLLRRPNSDQTGYELVAGLVADLALYDNAYLMVVDRGSDDAWEIRPIRPLWVKGAVGKNAYGVAAWTVQFPETVQTVQIPATSMLHFHGWDPANAVQGTSPVITLKEILAEQVHAAKFRSQLWQRGGRVNSYVTRPATAPIMSAEARQKFQRQFNAAYTGDDGSKAGGVPFLDEGAELKRIGFSAKEEQFVDVAKLSLSTVAAVYHVNPTMVGLLDNANYSNVREFRRMLYGETLGPIIRMIEERLNAFLLPMLGADDATYVEFNVDARLRGSQEEQAQVASQAVGAPYMTRNEYRALQNLPSIEGADGLVQPLNVTANGDPDPVPANPIPEGDPKAVVDAFIRELDELSAKEGQC